MHVLRGLCALLVILFAGGAAAAEIGRVILATGETSALRGGRTVALARGASIEEKDILQTGAASFLQVRFSDSSIMALKEQSRLGVEEYRFSGKPDGKEHVAFRLLKGAIRTITGAIGQARYEMRTNVSTVGIRGSMYALGVCEGDCRNADGEIAPDGTYGSVLGPAAGTNKLSSTNKSGETIIEQGQHFHVANVTSPPVLLIEFPSFLNAQLPGKPSTVASTTGPGTGGAAADSRPNSLPAPIGQIAASTTTTQVVGGPQNVTQSGLPTGVQSSSMMMPGGGTGFVGGPVGGGSGIVRGQLAWTTTADMDLHLILPNGQAVNFGTPSRTFNGATAMLDRDNTSGGTPSNPAVENITVNGTNVPAGNYTFFVRNFRSSGPTTSAVLRVTGDNNATGRTYNLAPLAGSQQSPNHVVTRNPDGTASYSP